MSQDPRHYDVIVAPVITEKEIGWLIITEP